jgi:Rieske Fe-S protein
MISDLIVYGKADWEEVYNPSRFTPGASAKNFVVENADVAKQLISGKLAAYPEDLDLKPGEGKIIELHGDKVGAFKDEDGKLHLIDSTCTHVGCELTWNSAERTWDCPCHGSRFTYEGEIVDGPAVKSVKIDLKPKK